jgi:hypothetical protein
MKFKKIIPITSIIYLTIAGMNQNQYKAHRFHPYISKSSVTPVQKDTSPDDGTLFCNELTTDSDFSTLIPVTTQVKPAPKVLYEAHLLSSTFFYQLQQQMVETKTTIQELMQHYLPASYQNLSLTDEELLKAVEENKDLKALYIIKENSDLISHRDHQGKTLLHYVAGNLFMDATFQACLKSTPALVEDHKGKTPLHAAIQGNNILHCKRLLEKFRPSIYKKNRKIKGSQSPLELAQELFPEGCLMLEILERYDIRRIAENVCALNKAQNPPTI